MATTTCTAICTSLKSTIEALDPAGDDEGLVGSFRQAPDNRTNEQLAKADLDREFRIGPILPTACVLLGSVAEQDFDANMPIIIWHRRTGNLTNARDRMTADIHQIILALQKKTGANWPTAVWLVRVKQVNSKATKTGWETTMQFRIRYTFADV